MPAPSRLARLKRRPEFLAVAASGRRVGAPAFTLQAGPRPDGGAAIGIGFTATRRLGGAVVRNRARRRLRAAVDRIARTCAAPGFDYVLIARPGVLGQPFAELERDLCRAFRRVLAAPARPAGARRP